MSIQSVALSVPCAGSPSRGDPALPDRAGASCRPEPRPEALLTQIPHPATAPGPQRSRPAPPSAAPPGSPSDPDRETRALRRRPRLPQRPKPEPRRRPRAEPGHPRPAVLGDPRPEAQPATPPAPRGLTRTPGAGAAAAAARRAAAASALGAAAAPAPPTPAAAARPPPPRRRAPAWTTSRHRGRPDGGRCPNRGRPAPAFPRRAPKPKCGAKLPAVRPAGAPWRRRERGGGGACDDFLVRGALSHAPSETCCLESHVNRYLFLPPPLTPHTLPLCPCLR
jgi:hypothetical protein